MKHSALFTYIEQLHGERPWGHVLDAGTGAKSLAWVGSLKTERWTAVTASQSMAKASKSNYPFAMREQDRIVVGNWIDPKLLQGEQFDTILLDYFVGAVEGFAPYWQESVLPRFAPLLAPGGRLYITALDPYVPLVAQDEVGQFVGDVGRLRDACLLLARERPYREFPVEWMMQHVRQTGLEVIGGQKFPIRYRERWLQGQLDMCRARSKRFSDEGLAKAMLAHADAMQERGLALLKKHDGLAHGFDYVMAARRQGGSSK